MHHTATARDKTTFVAVDRYHRDKWWFKSSLGFYIGYQYFIDAAGIVTQGRVDADVGAHTIGYNDKSLGICLAGNFDVEYPSSVQVVALTRLLKNKSSQYGIPPEKIMPHRAFANKNCYGKNLADDWARHLIASPNNVPALSEISALALSPNGTRKQELLALLEKALQITKQMA